MVEKKTVFTNGCFDILHAGHVQMLNEAKKQGSYLIVGLNSDTSVKRLKGETRPVNKQLDRKYLLENLKSVDEVIIFEEDTPLNLIKKIRPDVLVKGGDWSLDQIIGGDFVIDNGGEVKSLIFKDGYSTTNTIKKMQEN
jgi:D-glycero-beta-D-manno-heptose 1-phosphate adenylyltransferase